MKGDHTQIPGPASCSFSSQAEAEAEAENPPKKRSASLDPSPHACNWEDKSPPQEYRAEEGGFGSELYKKLDHLSENMGTICRDVSRLQNHLDRLEQNARGWVLELATLRMENRCLSEYVRRMESRCHILENRSRRNNLRMLGLPEGVEGSEPVPFLQKTLPTMLALPTGGLPLEVESARRVQGGISWDPNGSPRPLVFRLLRLADKMAVLQAARSRPLSYAGARVTILPDFRSSPFQRRRTLLGTFRRARWAADLCLGPQHTSCYYGWTQGPRETLAHSGPLPGEREGRVSKGMGNWGGREGSSGSGHSAGSCEPHNP